MPKPKKTQSIPAVGQIPIDALPVRFSFKHLDSTNQKFRPTDCCAEYFHRLVETIQRYSAWIVGDFTNQNNDQHRHIIDFEYTSEKEGFQHIAGLDQEQLGYNEGWQFSVYPAQPWCLYRAHGILIDDTFYFIWLDERHQLYPPGEA